MINRAQARRARFGLVELDLRAGVVTGDGESALLPDQAFQVLRLLLEREGELVSRDELEKAALAERYSG